VAGENSVAAAMGNLPDRPLYHDIGRQNRSKHGIEGIVKNRVEGGGTDSLSTAGYVKETPPYYSIDQNEKNSLGKKARSAKGIAIGEKRSYYLKGGV